jgi:hypothetical protein
MSSNERWNATNISKCIGVMSGQVDQPFVSNRKQRRLERGDIIVRFVISCMYALETIK